MKKKLLAFSTPAGLLLYLIYALGGRFLFEFPDAVAYPMMTVSIILLVVGIAYNSYCIKQKKNPYDFKK